jgi:hypothetical protein
MEKCSCHWTYRTLKMRGNCLSHSVSRRGSCTQERMCRYTYCIFDLRGSCPNHTPHPRDSCTHRCTSHCSYRISELKCSCQSRKAHQRGSGTRLYSRHCSYHRFDPQDIGIQYHQAAGWSHEFPTKDKTTRSPRFD